MMCDNQQFSINTGCNHWTCYMALARDTGNFYMITKLDSLSLTSGDFSILAQMCSFKKQKQGNVLKYNNF